MSATNDDRIKRERAQNIAWRRDLGIGTAFDSYLTSDPQHAIDYANAAFDEANRAEYEQQPVSL